MTEYIKNLDKNINIILEIIKKHRYKTNLKLKIFVNQ